MGSSPFTATIPQVSLVSELSEFFTGLAPRSGRQTVLVGFSGGPDSTALLWGLLRLSEQWPDLRVRAVHVDHGLDEGSGTRAEEAVALAATMGCVIAVARYRVHEERERGESLEAAARRVRYRVLEEHRAATESTWIATAHHADDQAETILLRLLSGTGLAGLAAIRPVHGDIVRPLLGLRRSVLHEAVAHLNAIRDPTNLDPRFLRNRVRREVLPTLIEHDPDLVAMLSRLASTAQSAAVRIDSILANALSPSDSSKAETAVQLGTFERLPPPLRAWALATLCRRLGAPHGPSAAAALELDRQIRAGHRAGGQFGRTLEWSVTDEVLRIRHRRPPTPPFSYTFAVPGEIEISEIDIRLRVRSGPVEDWMFSADSTRAGLRLDLAPGQKVEVRNRRHGDRVRPFGHRRPRRLKELLIDRRISRAERDRLPLLIVDGEIAWVPGVTTAETSRLSATESAWIVEIEPDGEENRPGSTY